MTKEELGKLDIGFIRALAGAHYTEGAKYVGTRKDGSFGELEDQEVRARAVEGRKKVCELLNAHYSLLLSALGLTAEDFRASVVYVPGPVILKFEKDDGTKLEVDYYDQLFTPRFKEFL